ncbi:uncharacterized protein FOMMEDRAFT_148390 [Fomitiporia mediterranea MF3/22]|uniref:uncharacterized protein n=1 Tax=Fomitiporia mediterranea (strain MF3/22) TaxID=694068 RepID=UPI00044088A7|nr:uncharacterized protein FOMMEDRAFT_148390 [Fomitiporia mediterranea MF3/22]EJD00015.1 hypothetical protein FOMMEDRAFT_148390 [Fomitiporia mediterranea MF3/22]
MKFLSLLSLAILSVSSTLADIIPPVYYPSDGTYFIYNAQFKAVFDNDGSVIAEGNPILGYPAHPQQNPQNQQWIVEAVGNTSNHQVTMRVVLTARQNPSAGGYATNVNGKIVHSKTAEAWTLQAAPNACSQFMFVENNTAITLDGSGDQLTVADINQNATSQHWVFVPIDQINDFLSENGSA